MRQINRINQCLLLILVSCLLLLAAVPSAATRCPREVRLILDSTPDTGLSPNRFIELCGPLFSGDGVTLTLGGAAPDYVLAVGYRTYEMNGKTHGDITAVLCFTGGTIGEAKPIGGVDVPIMGYGQVIAHDGYFGPGVSLDTIASHLAGFASLVPSLVREYERISESASIELPDGCYRPNEAREIRVDAPPGPRQAGVFRTDVKHRYIVRAEHGDIRNGTAWSEDDRTRVFLMDAERTDEASEFKLDYIAPIGCESDHVTVWSSCDVSHLPVKHPSTAPKHEIIAESDIPICGGYRLEYAHDFTIQHDEATLFYTLTGEVPLSLREQVYEGDRIVGGKLKGEATLPVIMAGNFRDCAVTYTNEMTVQVTGEIRRGGPGEASVVVQVELVENYGTVGAGVIDCPGQDPFTTGGVPTPTVTQGNEAQLIFKHEEGQTITRPFSADMVTGNATWIIHVPER